MKNLTALIPALMLCAAFSLSAQTFTIRPYVGYTQVRMSEVNNDMQARITDLMELNNQLIPIPKKLNGNYNWGIQGIYRFDEDYFLSLTTSFVKEKTEGSFSPQNSSYPFDYHFDRDIRFFDVNIGIQYYFNYSSWRPVNFYFDAGVGLGLGWSESNFSYVDGIIPDIDSHGEFSGNALTARIGAGVSFKIFSRLSLIAEGGYRFADLRQLQGKFSSPSGSQDDYTTRSSYDFSGFFVSIGTGFIFSVF